ncbi:hypothetical protein F5J12DRAFT_825612 [Pisolithus orientalis]|uniref:uncharacterized protein n=1 Tax=Pisolithus orientalis TaxID=936130 RepID=UPI00222550CB|nr:uncharacterized protein F5J12DRAFT_825612 [Pisolithus orientalis]KAI6008778.1 hypothetical protein F5J12DRAFT_825612 [Pisolithus orientalis]
MHQTKMFMTIVVVGTSNALLSGVSQVDKHSKFTNSSFRGLIEVLSSCIGIQHDGKGELMRINSSALSVVLAQFPAGP